MDIWTIPLIGIVLIICLISVLAARKSSKLDSLIEGKDEIGEAVEDHPFTLNPVIWVILVATAFIGIVIFYYAASF